MWCSHYEGKLKFGVKLEGDDGEGLVAAGFHFFLSEYLTSQGHFHTWGDVTSWKGVCWSIFDVLQCNESFLHLGESTTMEVGWGEIQDG